MRVLRLHTPVRASCLSTERFVSEEQATSDHQEGARSDRVAVTYIPATVNASIMAVHLSTAAAHKTTPKRHHSKFLEIFFFIFR